jgi:hypothetical protein
MECCQCSINNGEYRFVYQSNLIIHTMSSNLCMLMPQHFQRIWSEGSNDPGMQTHRFSLKTCTQCSRFQKLTMSSHQCRARHLRCDMQQPTCGHCRRGARNCSKESDHVILSDANVGIVRRRTRYDLSFDEHQTWIGLPPGM